MEILTSKRGKDMLAFKGYIYTKHNQKNNTIRWRCIKRHTLCRGIMLTSLDLENPYLKVDHNHAPSVAAVSAKKAIMRMKTKCANSAELPSQIYNNNLDDLSYEALSLLPSEEAIKRTLRNVRRNYHDQPMPVTTLDEFIIEEKMAAPIINYESLVKEKLPLIMSKGKDWALTHGILMRTADFPTSSDVVNYAPFALFPSMIPRSIYNEAKQMQTDFNLLMHKVAHDYDFLKESLKSVIEIDDFTRKLWEIYEFVYKNKTKKFQPLCLGLLRSDYMLHCPQGDSTISEDLLQQVQLKQIEINTIASSFIGLAENMISLHRYTLWLINAPANEEKLPENQAAAGFAAGLVNAWDLYEKSEAAILFVVSSAERNIFDQRWLEYGVLKSNPNIVVLRLTLQDLHHEGHLDEDNNLIVSGYEIAVVYFRSGYSPNCYKTEQDWDSRKMIECSNAIKCPSINYHLAGTKKIQQELSLPGVLEKFISDPERVQILRNTFAKQYSLEMGLEGDEAINEALNNVNSFVLKPQREGGGNNFFEEELQQELLRVKNSEERMSYILMERIFPLPQRNVLIYNAESKDFGSVISELGIYGVIIGDAEQIIYNEEVGHLLRTKPVETNEGGIASGFAVMDSPYLI